MKLFKHLALATSFLAFGMMAQAQDQQPSSSDNSVKDGGLFLEPMITYQSGDNTVSYPVSFFGDSKENVKGFGLGVRAGMHVYQSVFLGADGRYARPTYDSSALDGSGDAEATNYGVTLGAQTPLAGVRVWGTYILGGTLNPKEVNNVDVRFNDLKGYRLGAGLYVASFSVNLEYQDAKYDSTTVEKAGPITADFDSVKGTDKSYILSVSFPMAL